MTDTHYEVVISYLSKDEADDIARLISAKLSNSQYADKTGCIEIVRCEPQDE